MHKKRIAAVLATCMFAAAAGCAGNKQPSQTATAPETTAASTEQPTAAMPTATQPTTVPPATESRLKRITTFSQDAVIPYNAFSLELLRKNLKEDNSSLLVSPLSVLSALGMTANGANGETLQEFETAFGMQAEELNLFMAYLQYSDADDELLQSFENELGILTEVPVIHNANSLWLSSDRGFTAEQGFLDTAEQYYNAQVNTVPFDSKLPGQINGWVKENTDGMVDSILDNVEPNDVAYLVNAVAFDAKWEKPYENIDVRSGTFTCEDGTAQTVKMMTGTERADRCYLQDDNAEGFLKPYVGGRFAFAALLPDKGIRVRDYLNTLTGEKLTAILQKANDTPVEAMIPKFQGSYDVPLNESLQKMGIQSAFDMDAADLTRLGKSGNGDNLYLNKVLHKTFISVAEQGTRAGAATLASASGSAAPSARPRQIYLDRPFVYMLVNLKTNTPLFIGTLMAVSE